jgi:hypothetical protein
MIKLPRSNDYNDYKIQLKPTFRPLSIAQENAIDLLITGATDGDVAAAVGVDRVTVWQWRHEHPLFMATLQRRRADVWRGPQEKLRSLMSKAVENIVAAIEAGSLKASIELLKITGMFGDGRGNAIVEQDPERLLKQQAHAQIQREDVPKNEHELLPRSLESNRYQQRLAEIETELRERYCE